MRDMASERRRIFVIQVPEIGPRRRRTLSLPGPLGGIAMVADSYLSIFKNRRLLIHNDDLAKGSELALPGLPDQRAKYERELVDTDLSVVVLMLDQMVCVDAPVIDVGSMPVMVGRQPCRQ